MALAIKSKLYLPGLTMTKKSLKNISAISVASTGKLMTTPQHLDYDALNSLKDVMEGEFGFLIETFLHDSADRLDKLYTLIGSDNMDAIRRAAHSFKGSCSNLGAIHLANLCAALERKALENDTATFGEDLADIEAEFLIVKQRMHAYLR